MNTINLKTIYKLWEDIKIIAANNESMTSAAKVLFTYNADEFSRARALAREEYEEHEQYVQRRLAELTATVESVTAKYDTVTAERDALATENDALLARIRQLEDALANSTATN